MRRLSRAAHTRHAPGLDARALASMLLAALLCHSALVVALAQTSAAKGATPANGSVSGRVTTSDGKPAANVVVALSPTDYSGDRSRAGERATTGDDGRYKIAGVAAGRYRIQAVAPLYSSPDEQNNQPFNSGKTVTVGAGESVEDIDITLVRGGVITGRVTNQEGRPVIGERIYVVNADQQFGPAGYGGQILNTFDFDTDDRGVYRLYGVPPGRYLVSVGIPRDAGSIRVGPFPVQYQRTFYPGTTDASQAKPVEVSAGGEATGVDIALAEAPKSYEARGRFVDEEGKPVAGIGYGQGAVRTGSPVIGAWGSDGSVTNDAGEFVLRNLLPGRYAVFVANDFGRTPVDVYSDAVQFEVTNENVEGLVVKVHRGASISGGVVIEGTTDRAVLSKLAQLYVSARPQMNPGAPPATDQPTVPTFSQALVNPDGTFRVTGLRPGKFVLAVFSGSSRGFSMIGVQRAGADATGGIDVSDGEQVTGVRVRVGYGTGVIRGQIDLRSDGDPITLPPGARLNVIVMRAGSAQPIPSGFIEVDSRGHFVVEGLMGGEYELRVGVQMVRPGPPVRSPNVRQHVSVPDSGETSVTITCDIGRQTERNP